MATCGFGSTFGAGDHVSVAKSIWGEDEINRWLAGEAPDKDAPTTPAGERWASLQQSLYEGVAMQMVMNVDLLVTVP